ncbi:MAG: hypothetical protein KDD09_27005, partial [Phaeodactylibacter sp.]|nr:hypothetical protein [Phaeodactylibacter sp.]
HGAGWSFKDEYDIHLSLAYFGNQEYGRLFQTLKDNWQNYFQDKMKDGQGRDLAITFNSIGLYGFTDMATFFKVVRKENLH